MLDKTRQAGAVFALTVLGVLGLAGVASAATVPPDPSTIAGDLANNAGGSFLDALVAVLPKIIPFMVALWAIGFVWKKVAPKRGGVK